MPDNEHISVIDAVMIGEQPSAQKPRIVLVGSPGEGGAIREYLSQQLYEIQQANTAQDLSEFLSENAYDLVIVDAIVPDDDIVSLIQKISLKDKLFHLFVRSETDDEVDTVLALELGADDCVALSCSPREIKARVRALLRRRITDAQKLIEVSAERSSASGSELSYEGWILNRDRCLLFSPVGDVIDLTNAEYGILVKLFIEPGSVKDRSSLLNVDSESSEYDVRSLDVFVSRLRKKMAHYNGQDLIETVRGRGYRLSITPNRVTSGEP
jgi:two-component system torCAD operon response regulator TorR